MMILAIPPTTPPTLGPTKLTEVARVVAPDDVKAEGELDDVKVEGGVLREVTTPESDPSAEGETRKQSTMN
jgi:hypothetical protein